MKKIKFNHFNSIWDANAMQNAEELGAQTYFFEQLNSYSPAACIEETHAKTKEIERLPKFDLSNLSGEIDSLNPSVSVENYATINFERLNKSQKDTTITTNTSGAEFFNSDANTTNFKNQIHGDNNWFWEMAKDDERKLVLGLKIKLSEDEKKTITIRKKNYATNSTERGYGDSQFIIWGGILSLSSQIILFTDDHDVARDLFLSGTDSFGIQDNAFLISSFFQNQLDLTKLKKNLISWREIYEDDWCN